jgi:hypothetical protein
MTTPKLDLAAIRERAKCVADSYGNRAECEASIQVLTENNIPSLCDEVERLREALKLLATPTPELKDMQPVVLYFTTDTEREEFIDAVQEACPNLKPFPV